MIAKQTYSLPQPVWEPTANGQGHLFATSSVEITALKLVSGGSAALVKIYDSASANANNLRWILDSSTTYDDNQVFSNPLFFKNGVYAVIEQGGNFNCSVCVAGIPNQL